MSGLREGRHANYSLFAFVGVGLAANQNFGRDHEREEICAEIRNLFPVHAKSPVSESQTQEPVTLSLATLRFGQLLDQGCNAAIYEAELLADTGASVPQEDATAVVDDGASDASDDSDITVIHEAGLEASDDIDALTVDKAALTRMEESDVTGCGEDEAPMSLDSDAGLPSQTKEWQLEVVELQDSYVLVTSALSVEDAAVSDTESDILVLHDEAADLTDTDALDEDIEDEGGGTEAVRDSGGQPRCRHAVKMMFNYSVESVAEAIYREMAKEAVPARAVDVECLHSWQKGSRAKMKSLPPHPNIVEMMGLFVDAMPDLVRRDGLDRYPAALPRRLHEDGHGRNMTMFLVMKKYDCNLHQLLTTCHLDLGKRLSLLAQLLEGVAHMAANQIAHRDLKSDNLFVDTETFSDGPWLAVGDFGCCLAEGDLTVPYNTGEISKGGNAALMAPEIATAEVGWLSRLDYRRSDLWAVGAIAYELLGGRNPFYQSGKAGSCLDSRSYTADQLPPLPPNTPPVVARLINAMLNRDPKQRPSPDVAAAVLQLFLIGCPFLRGQGEGVKVTESQLLAWTVTYAACRTLKRISPSASSFLTEIFLSRISYGSLKGVAKFLQEN